MISDLVLAKSIAVRKQLILKGKKVQEMYNVIIIHIKNYTLKQNEIASYVTVSCYDGNFRSNCIHSLWCRHQRSNCMQLLGPIIWYKIW